MRRLLSRFWSFLKGDPPDSQSPRTGDPSTRVEEARALHDMYGWGSGGGSL